MLAVLLLPLKVNFWGGEGHLGLKKGKCNIIKNTNYYFYSFIFLWKKIASMRMTKVSDVYQHERYSPFTEQGLLWLFFYSYVCIHDKHVVSTYIRICMEAFFIIRKDWISWFLKIPSIGTDLTNWGVMCGLIWEPLLCGIKHFSSSLWSRKWLLNHPVFLSVLHLEEL